MSKLTFRTLAEKNEAIEKENANPSPNHTQVLKDLTDAKVTG